MSGDERRDFQAAPDAALSDALRRLGYDIEPTTGNGPSAGGFVARRDLEDRGILLAVDRSGRFRVEITWLVGEWPSGLEIGGIAMRAVDSVTRSVSLTGHVGEPRQLLEVVAGLGQIVPWAGAPARGEAAPKRPAGENESPPPS